MTDTVAKLREIRAILIAHEGLHVDYVMSVNLSILRHIICELDKLERLQSLERMLREPGKEVIEEMARAICAADKCDPDAPSYGLGNTMPDGERYPLWKARISQAKAALAVLSKKAGL